MARTCLLSLGIAVGLSPAWLGAQVGNRAQDILSNLGKTSGASLEGRDSSNPNPGSNSDLFDEGSGRLLLDRLVSTEVPLRKGSSRESSSGTRTPSRAPGVPSVPDFDSNVVTPGPVELGARGKIRFEVLEIRPLRGNNPLDPLEPLLNFGGVRVQTVPEVLALAQGQSPPAPGAPTAPPTNPGANPGGNPGANPGGTPAGLLSCLSTTGMDQQVNSPTLQIFVAAMGINPNTLECFLPPVAGAGPGTENFSFSADRFIRAVGTQQLVGHFAVPPDWQFLVNGSPTSVPPSTPPNQVDTLVAVSSAGIQIEMQIRVNDPGVGIPTLTILSLRRLN